MGMKLAVARNVLWNWAGIATNMLAVFLVAPFLVHSFGDTTYGLWVLIGSLTSYFGLLDLGVRFSVGRSIAFHRAKGDPEGVNAIVNTTLVILGTTALLALAGTVGVSFLFFHLFHVPPSQEPEVRLAILLVGANLAVALALDTFEAALWASNRFDLINIIDIGTIILRLVLILYFVGQGYGLVALALITFLLTVGNCGAKTVAALRVNPQLRLGWSYVKREAFHSLFHYSSWYFLLSIARMVTAQIAPILIGVWLSVELVTSYNIAARLVSYATSVVAASAGVLTPLATALHAREQHSRQQELFLQGGKYCLALAIFFLSLLLILGKPLITLWMGPAFEHAYRLLVILTLGEALPMSQLLSFTIIVGMARHKALACLSVVDNVIVVGLAAALVTPYNVAGICLALALGGALCRGALQLWYACRLLHLRLRECAVRSLFPPLLTAAVPVAGLAVLASWHPPANWPLLILYTGGFGISYGIACTFLLGYERLKAHLGKYLAPLETATL
jgi:O-antigen/teichoic acid export membrane protein